MDAISSNLLAPNLPASATGASKAGVTPQQIEAVGTDFEGVFLSMMIKEMRKSLDNGGFFAGESRRHVRRDVRHVYRQTPRSDEAIGDQRHDGATVPKARCRHASDRGKCGRIRDFHDRLARSHPRGDLHLRLPRVLNSKF